MKIRLRRAFESDWAGAAMLAVVATIALAFVLWTAPTLHAQGESVGTLPYAVVSDQGPGSFASPALAIPSGRFEYVYRSGGGDVHVIADQQTSEEDGHFAHRCALKVAAFKLEFPPDGT